MNTLEERLTKIAREHLDIQTLQTRKMDGLDFHEVAVWELRAALEAAYRAGQTAGCKRSARQSD